MNYHISVTSHNSWKPGCSILIHCKIFAVLRTWYYSRQSQCWCYCIFGFQRVIIKWTKWTLFVYLCIKLFKTEELWSSPFPGYSLEHTMFQHRVRFASLSLHFFLQAKIEELEEELEAEKAARAKVCYSKPFVDLLRSTVGIVWVFVCL